MEGIDVQHALRRVHRTRAAPDRVGRRPPAAGPAPALARLRDLALVPAIIVIAIVGQLVNPVFLQPDNLINVLQTMSEIALLVLAETLVLIAGKMDLSLESTFGLAPGRRRLADRRRPARRTASALLPGAWADPDHPAGRRADRLRQRPADRPVPAQRLHRHARHADRAARPAHRHLRRPDLLRAARVDDLPGQHALARHAGLDLDLPARLFAVGDRRARLHPVRPLAVRDRRQRRRGPGGRHPHRPGAVDRR